VRFVVYAQVKRRESERAVEWNESPHFTFDNYKGQLLARNQAVFNAAFGNELSKFLLGTVAAASVRVGRIGTVMLQLRPTCCHL